MNWPREPIITNKARENRFRPLASAQDPSVRPTYTERFVLDVPPRVISNEESLPFQTAQRFDPDTPPTNIVQILQLALPVPMPVGVVLGAYDIQDDRFRHPARFDAESDTGGAEPEGRYIIEWGTGEARNHAFTDLAPGSLQIPAAQFVNISAHLYAGQTIAGASAYPGALLGNASAYYSSMLRRQDADASTVTRIQPFAREATGHVGVSGPASNNYAALQGVFELSRVLLVHAEYLIPAPIRANGYTRPQPFVSVPLPGAVDRCNYAIENVSSPDGPVTATATFIQTIRC